MNARVVRRRCQPRLVFLPLYGVVLIGMVLSGCGDPATQPAPPAPEEEAEPAEPPPPEPISVSKLSPITLDAGGRASVTFEVERNGNQGPIKVAAGTTPDGVTIAPIEIPAEESKGTLEVVVDQKLGDEQLVANVLVTAKVGEVEAEQTLGLTISKLILPRFLPGGGVLLQPGSKATVEVQIERNGFKGPLQLSVEGLPQKVTGTVAAIPADKTTTKLELAAAADAPNADQQVRVVVTLYGRKLDVQVPVQIEGTPYRVQSFVIVTIKPSETKQVQLPVVRYSYKGPLTLEMANLPDGVTVPKVQVSANQTQATLQFVAAADAKEWVRSAKVVSTGGNLSRSDPLIIRVSRGEQGFLPQEITANEDLYHLLRRGSFGGRLTVQSKQALVDAYGGTPESEAAVFRGLKWLAEHQQPDGRWSLKNYSQGIDSCDCHSEFEKEVVDEDTAGTAFGVLPFLGAGVTHERAPASPPELADYKIRVENAIAFLVRSQVRKKDSATDGHLGGNMYVHALGTMALCEAYGLSGDERLKIPAQLAIKYLAESQHESGGGWRYSPGQAGDMSVTGWVFLAIRSGQLAGLTLDRAPLIRAGRFVDSCAVGPEEARLSRYTYQPEGDPRLALTAAGLLTRLYLRWPKDDPDLAAGCAYLMENLPPESGGNLGVIYYHYYATQVLHHMEGSDFDLWNHRMREHLIRSQEKSGHKTGSWNPQGSDRGDKGGRLYSTSMALMTLQVYYRHLPMFRPVTRGEGGVIQIR